MLENPFDVDRNMFIERCKKYVPYLKRAKKENLKTLYYKADLKFYQLDENLFHQGDICQYMYIVLSGVIEISMITRNKGVEIIDLMGFGSIIGTFNVLDEDEWHY